MTISAWPLQWPVGWKRAPHRTHARFSKGERYAPSLDPNKTYMRQKDITVADGVKRVLKQLIMMGIERDDIVISTNVPVRLDGLPRSNSGKSDDPGVAVYWKDGAKSRVMAIDRYIDVADNLAAVAATLDAMRAIDRQGMHE